MLLAGNAAHYAAQQSSYDRRWRKGAGQAADVWALGCLLYELLTGEFLFHDPDWTRFFMRLAQPGQVQAADSRAVLFTWCCAGHACTLGNMACRHDLLVQYQADCMM